MSYYIIWHPMRKAYKFDNKIYFSDPINKKNNQDPYVWNKNILWSYCQLNKYVMQIGGRNSPKSKLIDVLEEGDIVFFVTSNPSTDSIYLESLKEFKENIYCDLVFKVESIINWNKIVNKNPKNFYNYIKNSMTGDYLLQDHLGWMYQHPNIKNHKTFIADKYSFQPQIYNNLAEIKNLLSKLNYDTSGKKLLLKWSNGSRPIELSEENGKKLFDELGEYENIYGDKFYEERNKKDNAKYFGKCKYSKETLEKHLMKLENK
ncbi:MULTISPECIES: hypothetical protein [unclassified Staphylococcus]|uniref:hypothetical protein n=1 Tax=unclassified Staphylococcus TaxID=91994 RepID=UPI0021CE6931|nr:MULTISPECIES: hypothetical protein [unclassified Staphylococcus]UXR75875.1 hypothetical protein MUA74_09495 [Staphylococcus sp. IVB6233]UXR80072.1 hypothetical protein MUA65_09100 [Staphylococcus sp. IVB6218]